MVRELEFVCHNSSFPDSSSLDSLKALYKDLQTVPGIFSYMQDFSDESETQVSLAVLFTDWYIEPEAEIQVRALAKKHRVAIDTIDGEDIRPALEGRLADVRAGRMECQVPVRGHRRLR